MVDSDVSLTSRVVGAFGGIVGLVILGKSMLELIEAMEAGSTTAFVALAGTGIGMGIVIIGTMIVFGSLWAKTHGKVGFVIAAIFCGLRYGATGSSIWALEAGMNFVIFTLLLRKPSSSTTDTVIDEEKSGTWVGMPQR